MAEALDDCAPGRTRVLRGYDPLVDAAVLGYDTGRRAPATASSRQALSELRLVKDDWEIAQLQDAIDATVRGFEDVARILPADRPVTERLLDGVFGLRARHDGNDVGYSSIVGAGAHATILHWIRNDRGHPAGRAAADGHGRGEPRALHGRRDPHGPGQRHVHARCSAQVYDIVYASQQAGIDAIRPGVRSTTCHQTCMRVLAEGLYDLGLLPVLVDEAMDSDSRRSTADGRCTASGTCSASTCTTARPPARRSTATATLAEGYVLTVEPGLYFQPEDELVPDGAARYRHPDRGRRAGHVDRRPQVLSAGLPRAAAEDVESWLADQRDAGPRLPA